MIAKKGGKAVHAKKDPKTGKSIKAMKLGKKYGKLGGKAAHAKKDPKTGKSFYAMKLHAKKDPKTGKSLHAMRIGKATWERNRKRMLEVAMNGSMASAKSKLPNGKGLAGVTSTHNTYHAARKKFNPECWFCQEDMRLYRRRPQRPCETQMTEFTWQVAIVKKRRLLTIYLTNSQKDAREMLKVYRANVMKNFYPKPYMGRTGRLAVKPVTSRTKIDYCN